MPRVHFYEGEEGVVAYVAQQAQRSRVGQVEICARAPLPSVPVVVWDFAITAKITISSCSEHRIWAGSRNNRYRK